MPDTDTKIQVIFRVEHERALYLKKSMDETGFNHKWLDNMAEYLRLKARLQLLKELNPELEINNALHEV